VPDTIVQTRASSIVVRKYDGQEHRRWPARLVRHDGSLLVFDARFDRDIEHDQLGTIARNTASTEYYWLDRWYNVFRFAGTGGRCRNFYCNVNTPPEFDGEVLSYIDLDIDILVEPNLRYRVLDLEEFEENAHRFNYPREVRVNAEKALGELIGMIESRAFPFAE